MRKSRWLSGLAGAVVVGGAALMGVYYSTQRAADHAQRDAQEWLSRATTSRQTARPSAEPSHRRVHHGDVLGRLTVPRLNLSVMVFEGDDAAILKQGAGHIPATSLPHEN